MLRKILQTALSFVLPVECSRIQELVVIDRPGGRSIELLKSSDIMMLDDGDGLEVLWSLL